MLATPIMASRHSRFVLPIARDCNRGAFFGELLRQANRMNNYDKPSVS